MRRRGTTARAENSSTRADGSRENDPRGSVPGTSSRTCAPDGRHANHRRDVAHAYSAWPDQRDVRGTLRVGGAAGQ